MSLSDLTTGELLEECRRRGITLSARIDIADPNQQLDAELVEQVKKKKPELLIHFASEIPRQDYSVWRWEYYRELGVLLWRYRKGTAKAREILKPLFEIEPSDLASYLAWGGKAIAAYAILRHRGELPELPT